MSHKFSCAMALFLYPGHQRFFSRAAGIFGVGRRPKARAAKPREKPLARSGAFYVSRGSL